MAKRFKERELREEYPNLDEVLVRLLNDGGQVYAAFQLGTTQATISQIIKRSTRIQRINRYELRERKQPA
jgi:hypothetical protein